MRLIFMDEAGTSAREPITVVAGVIADPDAHLITAETLVREAYGSVPRQHREGFVFHATEIFNSRRYQEEWSMTDRIELLTTLMSIPRRIGMALIIAAHWRHSVPYELGRKGPRMHQFEHIMSVYDVVALADRNIRKYARAGECGLIIAEDCAEMRRYLRDIPRSLNELDVQVSPHDLRRTSRDLELGYLAQRGDYRATKIRNPIHFVDKADDMLVQITDACAFGARRYLSKESFGDVFADALVGDGTMLDIFCSPRGAECFWPK